MENVKTTRKRKNKRKTQIKPRGVTGRDVSRAFFNEEQTDEELKRRVKETYKLDEKDRVILKELFHYLELEQPLPTNGDLGALVGLTDRAVAYRRKRPAFAAAWSDIMRGADQLLHIAAKDAARKLRKHIADPDPSISLQAIKIALSPYMNQHQVTITPVKVYDSTMKADGTLVQTIIEGTFEEIENKIEEVKAADEVEYKNLVKTLTEGD